MFIRYNYYWSRKMFVPLFCHQCNSVLSTVMWQKLEESLLNPDSSAEEKALTVQSEDVDSFSTPVPALIRQIITRNLADGSSGTYNFLICYTEAKRTGYAWIVYPEPLPWSTHNFRCCWGEQCTGREPASKRSAFTDPYGQRPAAQQAGCFN